MVFWEHVVLDVIYHDGLSVASGQVGDFYIVSQVKVQSSYFTAYMVGCKPHDSILVHISVQVPSCNVGRCFGVWTNSYGPLFVTLESNAILCNYVISDGQHHIEDYGGQGTGSLQEDCS